MPRAALAATTRACPMEPQSPNSGLKMVMPASARSNWKAHLDATFWRTLDGKNPNGWFQSRNSRSLKPSKLTPWGRAMPNSRGKKKV